MAVPPVTFAQEYTVDRQRVDRVTTLPVSPFDGQMVDLVAGTSIVTGTSNADEVLWRLRYNVASLSTHKWEFVGGSPLTVIDTTLRGVVCGSNTSIPIADFTWLDGVLYRYFPNHITQSASLTLPVAGDYLCSLQANFIPVNADNSLSPGFTNPNGTAMVFEPFVTLSTPGGPPLTGYNTISTTSVLEWQSNGGTPSTYYVVPQNNLTSLATQGFVTTDLCSVPSFTYCLNLDLFAYILVSPLSNGFYFWGKYTSAMMAFTPITLG